jgi:hypothetical protein
MQLSINPPHTRKRKKWFLETPSLHLKLGRTTMKICKGNSVKLEPLSSGWRFVKGIEQ